MAVPTKKNIFQLLGPGLLFAGAAVGVSHLVYATKAGANYGFGLLWIVLVVNLLKYPFFEFGARYAIARGESLLEGYQRLGKGVLGLFVLITLGTMFTVIAAVSVVTASLASYLIGDFWSLQTWSLTVLLCCGSLLAIGKYQSLDNLMKVVIIGLTLLTLATVVVAFAQTTTAINWSPFWQFDKATLAFLIPFMGWMPAPLDLSVWHSLWALEKQKNNLGDFDVKQSLLDFNIGYVGTILLAILFMALGALIMFPTGQNFAQGGSQFAAQLISLYTSTLGSTVGMIVAIAAFVTMFSTTITCLDALPRSMAKAHLLLTKKAATTNDKSYYFGWMGILIIGSVLLLYLLLQSLGTFLALATALSFLTAPFFAVANYILVTKHLPPDQRPQLGLRLLSLLGIVFLLFFCLLYLFPI